MSAIASSNRIASMDQFRGYTVAGMFLVNFVGHTAAMAAVLKHNFTYFSYADSIMPSFMFAVGFSYRLTVLKRLPQLGAYKTYISYFKRSMALILITLMTAGLGSSIGEWKQFDGIPTDYAGPKIETKTTAEKKDDSDSGGEKKGRKGKRGGKKEGPEVPWWKVEIPEHFGLRFKIMAEKILKADLWETLAIIGVSQIFIMPVISKGAWVRALALVGCMLGHTAMAHSFDWQFQGGLDSLYRVGKPDAPEKDFKYVHGVRGLAEEMKSDALPVDKAWEMVRWAEESYTLPDGRVAERIVNKNWMDRLWQIRGMRSWDGGCFGIVSWSIAMLAGSLVYDLMARSSAQKAYPILLVSGALLMIVGYGMSCLARLYDLEPVPGLPEMTTIAEARDKKIKEVEKERDGAIKKIPADKKDDEKKSEEERLKKEAEAKVAAIKAEFDPQIEKVRKENEAGIERAEKINYGYWDTEKKVFHAGLSDRRAGHLATSPVIPDFARAKGRKFQDLLAEAPFWQPPSADPGELAKGKPVRIWNYWMMGKRTVNQSFMVFAIGFAIFLYAFFVVLCDIGSLRVGLFRTFGMNPLAAYIIHEVTSHTINGSLVPEDSPVWYGSLAFVVFFAITYLLVRGLEKQNIYIRM